jgi:osmotically-inducible protein OsmY
MGMPTDRFLRMVEANATIELASEINVETFKGVVQLSGFVSSRADIQSAVRVASAVNGVKSVKNDMQLK